MINIFDLDRVNRFVLRKQHLSDDSKIDDVVQIVKDIGGLHATGPMGPYLSLFVRTRNFKREDLDEELYVKKYLRKKLNQNIKTRYAIRIHLLFLLPLNSFKKSFKGYHHMK